MRGIISDKVSVKDQKWVNAIYYRAFPTLCGIKCESNKIMQKKGVDKYFCFRHFPPVKIDEKIRYYDYEDLLLEDYSNYERRTPGWTRDKSKITDYIVYIRLPARSVWFIRYPTLRQYFLENYDHLFKEYVTNSKTGDYIWGETLDYEGGILYKTANIPIPLTEFPEEWREGNFWRYNA